jgi:hypothetical protein
MVASINSAGITRPIDGLRKTVTARSVGGETFKSIEAFEKAISRNGTAVLAPGQSMKIKVGVFGMGGGAAPSIQDTNKDSPFVTKQTKDGYLVITAKPTAIFGTRDNVKLNHGSPASNNPKSTVFPFSLEVGIGRLG